MADLPSLKGIRLLEVLESKAWHSFYEGVLLEGDVPVVVEALDSSAPESSRDQLKERYGLLSKLDVENVSAPLLFGEEAGLMFMAVEKETVDRLVDHLGEGEFLDPSEATRLVLEVAKALKSIHDLGHVHGELSPSNVLFHEHGRVKIKNVFRFQNKKDYLLALLPTRSEYISPEHLRMEEVVSQSDQYLLGLIFFHLLTGHPPFSGEEMKDVWKLHLEEPMPPLPSHLELLEGLEDVLGKMLAKRPEDRFADDDNLLAALEELEDVMLSGDVPEEEGTYYVAAPLVESEPEPEPEPDEESPSSKREGRKRKSSGKGKISKGKRNWKKKVESKPTALKKTSRRSSKNEKEPNRVRESSGSDGNSLFPILASIGALVVIGLIFLFWSSQGVDPHERSEGEKEGEVQPVRVVSKKVKSKKEEAPSIAKSFTRKLNPLVKKPVDVSTEEEAPVLESELSDAKKARLQEISRLPRKEAIAKLQLMLEDDDPVVRSIAAQTLVDLKGRVDLEEEFKLDGEELLASGLDKIEHLPGHHLISYLESLVSSANQDPVIIEILKASLRHNEKKVQIKGMDLLKKKSLPDYHRELASSLMVSPGEQVLYQKALREPIEFLKVLEAATESRPKIRVQLLGVWSHREDWGSLKKFMLEEKVYFLPCLLILAQDPKVGKQELTEMLGSKKWDEGQRILLLSVHRALGTDPRELLGHIDEKKTDSSPYFKAYRLASVHDQEGEPEAGSLKWGYAIRLADLPENPGERQLESLVEGIGSLDPSMNRRLLSVLKAWPDRVVPLMIAKMKSKPDRDTRRDILKFMSEENGPESVAFLLDQLGSKLNREEELELITKGIESSGDLALDHLMASSRSVYEKAKLLSDLDLPGGMRELPIVLDSCSSIDFKRIVAQYIKEFSTKEHLVKSLLSGLKKPSHLAHLILSVRKIEEHGLSGEMVELLSHEDEKVRMGSLKSLLSRFPGDASLFREVAGKLKGTDEKVLLAEHLKKENEYYQALMTGLVADESRKVREVTLDILIESGVRWGSPRFLSRLLLEEKASLRGKLARHLLSDLKEAHPLVLLWGEKSLPSSLKKSLKLELAERSASLDVLRGWKKMLAEPYGWPFKELLLQFLSKNGILGLAEFYEKLDMRNEKTLKEFHKAVDSLGSKAVPNLLQWMGKESSPLIREELKKALEKMDVKYRLDSKTGRFISL